MLKKVVVTNYKDETVTYSIVKDIRPTKNRLAVTLEDLKERNTNNGTWSGNVFTFADSDLTVTVELDGDSRITGYIASGDIDSRSHQFFIGDPIAILNGVEYKLSGCHCESASDENYSIRALGSVGSTTYSVSNVRGDTSINTQVFHGDNTITFTLRFYSFTPVTISNVRFDPMLRLASESNEFAPYDPHGGEEIGGNSDLFITSIDGLGPVKATVNMTEIPTSDGGIFNSARLTSRNIVIKALYKDDTCSIEEARHLTYKYFPVKSKVKIQVVTDTRTVDAEGYVESNEPDIFNERSGCQISITCPSAYFEGEDIEEELEYGIEKTLTYSGDAETGMEVTMGLNTYDLMSDDTITNPIVYANDKQIAINTDKMAQSVPNTSPNHLDCSLGIFGYKMSDNVELYKFLKESPVRIQEYYSNVIAIDNSTIHIFSVSKHYTFKENALGEPVIEFVDDFPDNIERFADAVFYNGAIHLLGGTNSHAHYTWDESHGWNKLSDLSFQMVLGRSAAVFDGAIHVVGGTNVTNYYGQHYAYNGSTWGTKATPPSTTQTAYWYPTALGNYLYIFDTYQRKAYKMLEGTNTWVTATAPPVKPTAEDDFFLTDGSKIHFFYSFDREHYVMNTSEEWTQLEKPPLSFKASKGCVMGTNILIFGGYQGNYFNWEPNNNKVIDRDKLVINTNKGKKSLYLYRDGNRYNILNTFESGSTWIQLMNGVNKLRYEATGEPALLDVKVKASILYEGV